MSAPDLSFLEGHDVAVYSFASCPDCVRLKRWMQAYAFPYREVDIDADPAEGDRLERETGKMAVPFLLIDNQHWVRGYHKEVPGRFDPELFLRELRGALAG
jgi:glutaredoxin